MGQLQGEWDVEAHEPPNERRGGRGWPTIIICTALLYVMIGTVSIHLAGVSYAALALVPLWWRAASPPFYAFSTSQVKFEKPANVRIVALVTYRRPETTATLDCYLQRNLAEHGGLLDEVIFIPETSRQDDLDFLRSLVNQTEAFSVAGWDDVTYVTNDLYIYIDGDVVYVEDSTIPTIVKTKLDYPDYATVSANVIYQPAVSGLHGRLDMDSGVELAPNSVSPSCSREDAHTSHLRVDDGYPSQQRWFSARNHPRSFDEAPQKTTMEAKGTKFERERSWAVNARRHHAFLEQLEQGDLRRYKFPLWKNPPKEISKVFFCMRGGNMEKMIHTDSVSLTDSVIIDGKGVASYYDWEGSDGVGAEDTILKRYRMYATSICGGRNDSRDD